MKNWATLEPDVVKILNKHYTPGRGGQPIKCVVIHHNAGMLSIDQIWQVWQTRAASAHYQVESGGRIGQLVWDRDTAWHAANSYINQTSIGIEIANSGGAAQDWPITGTAIEEAAHLVAAICRYYKLGAPKAGSSVRFHREFTGTSCPHHLAPGGKYYQTLMSRAAFWYERMGNPAPAPTPAKPDTVEEDMNADQNRMLQEIWDQLRGPGGKGWPQLGQNEKGQNLTLIDAIAALRADVDELKEGE